MGFVRLVASPFYTRRVYPSTRKFTFSLSFFLVDYTKKMYKIANLL